MSHFLAFFLRYIDFYAPISEYIYCNLDTAITEKLFPNISKQNSSFTYAHIKKGLGLNVSLYKHVFYFYIYSKKSSSMVLNETRSETKNWLTEGSIIIIKK